MARKRDHRNFTPIMSLSFLALILVLINVFFLVDSSEKTFEPVRAVEPTPLPTPSPLEDVGL